MPARGMTPESVPADVLIALVRNADAFEASLSEYVKRKSAAEKAEKKAGEALNKVKSEQDKLTAERKAHEQTVEEHLKQVAAKDQEYLLKDREQDRREQKLNEKDASLKVVSDEQKKTKADLLAEASLNAQRSDMLDTRAAELDRDKRKLEADKTALVQREARLKTNLDELKKRLEGFSF